MWIIDLSQMATLYRYKCKGCGYTILSSKNGDHSLLCGPGHYYICPKCKDVFSKNWTHKDMDSTSEDYSYEKDIYLANLLAKTIPADLQEVFIKDVSWFQSEVIKGEESKYYGKTLNHDAVKWTKKVFWEKLFKFLQRKDYAKSIKIDELRAIVDNPLFEKYARYINVRCNHCNEHAILWSPIDGCPKCGNILELELDSLILAD